MATAERPRLAAEPTPDLVPRFDDRRALEALSALGQETRLTIFRLLLAHEPIGLPAGTVAERLGVLQNTLSTHLAVLARAGLISGLRDGRSIVYRADLAGMRGLVGYLLTDCCGGRPEICAPISELLDASCGCGSAAS